jgi:hypothetical protein
VVKRKQFPYAAIDWSAYREITQRSANALVANFSPPHNLFNPVKWLRRPDGSLLKVEKGNEVGVEALTVTKITPLYLTIAMDKGSGGGSGFTVIVTREAATNVFLRSRPVRSYISLDKPKDNTGLLVLKEVKGAPDKPEAVVELTDSGERVSFTRDQPYQRVDGFKADFHYSPETKNFPEKRVGDVIVLAGEVNSIIDIKKDEVVFSSQPNNKRTILKLNAAP